MYSLKLHINKSNRKVNQKRSSSSKEYGHPNIEKQIEFDKIKEIWSGLAITDKAKERIYFRNARYLANF